MKYVVRVRFRSGSHSSTDYPILLLGGGGGTLRSPGIHVRRPRGNATDLLAIHQALGTGVAALGKDALASTTAATELLAG